MFHCVKSVQTRSLFLSLFSRVGTDYKDLLRKSPYSAEYGKIRTRENSVFGHFSRSVHFPSYSVKRISFLCLGSWWRYEICISKILNFDFLENDKSFWSKIKNIFSNFTSASFRKNKLAEMKWTQPLSMSTSTHKISKSFIWNWPNVILSGAIEMEHWREIG